MKYYTGCGIRDSHYDMWLCHMNSILVPCLSDQHADRNLTLKVSFMVTAVDCCSYNCGIICLLLNFSGYVGLLV